MLRSRRSYRRGGQRGTRAGLWPARRALALRAQAKAFAVGPRPKHSPWGAHEAGELEMRPVGRRPAGNEVQCVAGGGLTSPSGTPAGGPQDASRRASAGTDVVAVGLSARRTTFPSVVETGARPIIIGTTPEALVAAGGRCWPISGRPSPVPGAAGPLPWSLPRLARTARDAGLEYLPCPLPGEYRGWSWPRSTPSFPGPAG